MNRYILIALALFAISCSKTSEIDVLKTLYYESLTTETTRSDSPNLLTVLISRELTEKTTFIPSNDILEEMTQGQGIKSLFHRHLYNAILLKQKGKYPESLESILSAEKIITKDIPAKDIGLLYMGEVVLYRYMNAHYKASKAALKASYYYDLAQDKIGFYNSVIEASRSYNLMGNQGDAMAMLHIVQTASNEITPILKAKYYDTLLSIFADLKHPKLGDLLRDIKEEVDEEYAHWLNIAYINDQIGKKEAAEMALKKYRLYNPGYEENTAYHGIHASIADTQDHYKEALQSQMKYNKGIEDLLTELTSNNALYSGSIGVDERIRTKGYILISALCIIMLILAFVCIVGKILKKKQNEIKRYSELLNAAESEMVRLKTLCDNNSLNKEIREILIQRMDIFNQFILSQMSPNYSEKYAVEELAKLIASKDSFLESTCKTFELIHPKFADYLSTCDLTEKERGCCYLYCMGMRGNEIAAYMGLTDHSYYNLSGVIRKKLCLMEYKGNLDSFLRDKLTSFD